MAILWIIGIIVSLATIYYFRSNRGPSRSTSSQAISDSNESASKPSTSNDTSENKKDQSNVFKDIYSKLIRKKSASLTELPKLQRRHSTVGSTQEKVAKAAKKLIPEFFQRQHSIGGAREALPKPPSEFFEPLALPEIPERYKPLNYIRRNTKLLELPSCCIIKEEDIQLLTYETNEFVAKPGDPDDSIYVVLEGCLAVYITPSDGKTSMVRHIVPGDSFFSPLSLLDLFMDKPSVLKTVSLKAAIRTRVAKYSIANFYKAYKENTNNSAWVRTVQIITTRLLHVVLTTLHQHLGLGEELVNKRLTSLRPRGQRGQSMRATNRLKPKLKRMSTELENSNDEQKVSLALDYFREALQLTKAEAEKLLRPCMKILRFEENHTIFEEGNTENNALGMVISGVLKLTQESPFADTYEYEENSKDSWSIYIHPRELILTDESFYTVKAACCCIVAFIDKKDVDTLIEQKPSIVFPIAYSVLQRVSSFVRAIDFALGWILLDSGEALYRKGDTSDSVFVVLSGRLRSVTNKMMAWQGIEEFGKGDVLGIIEVLQQNHRTTTVLAVRYSQLAKVPEGMLNFVKMQFPQVGFRLVRLLGHYYSGRMSSSYFTQTHHNVPDPMTQKNLHTLAVFPASIDVPLVAFTCELYHALSTTTRVLRLSSHSVVERLGEEAVMERKADFRLMHWLNSQEDIYHLVIYECDYTATNWTRRCLSQADAILVVALGNQKPPEKHFIDDYLKLNQEGIRSRKELVLLWQEQDANPTGTYEWLKGSWFSGHYHIHAPGRMFNWESKINKNEKPILEFYEHHVFPVGIDVHSDFARLGRILSGNAVGLVLGGGGARGGAHVGVIKALRENGIPVDMVGGTSIGSMIGGILASNPYDMGLFENKTEGWFKGMCSYWKTILDLTWAFTARFTGFNFNVLLQDVFDDKNIEDLWLSYFCITTDITNSEMRVHRNGQLWRYVRASMSLAVYLPPICDSEDGHYLLDGGYVNNLPADVMRTMGARTVIAIDVSSANEKDFHNYGDSLNGFYAQFIAVMPWWQKEASRRILTSQEIQDRLAFVSSVRQLELVKKAPYCNYLRPPIDGFETLDFHKFKIIQDVGHQYAAECIPELIQTNNHLKTLTNHEKLLTLVRNSSAIRAGSRSLHNSFTDLAAQISRIPPKYCRSLDDLSKVMDEEEEDENEHEEEETTNSDNGALTNGGNTSASHDDEYITIKATFRATIYE